jgi:hypothetical protein
MLRLPMIKNRQPRPRGRGDAESHRQQAVAVKQSDERGGEPGDADLQKAREGGGAADVPLQGRQRQSRGISAGQAQAGQDNEEQQQDVDLVAADETHRQPGKNGPEDVRVHMENLHEQDGGTRGQAVKFVLLLPAQVAVGCRMKADRFDRLRAKAGRQAVGADALMAGVHGLVRDVLARVLREMP